MKTAWLRAAAFAVVCGVSVTASADVRLPAVFNSHMVLQREKPLPVWGWADPDEEVTVQLGENSAKAKADALGRWRVTLPELKSGGDALTMTVTGKNKLQLDDILIGEVWVGSGQSNMQWVVSQSANPEAEIAAAKFPKIRHFFVPLVPSGTPADDVVADWKLCTPENAGGFSAVLYFFGRHLHQELEGVPIGLIATSWGGTRIEPWIPPVGFELDSLKTERQIVETSRANFQKTLKTLLPRLKPWLASAEKAAAAGEPLPEPPQIPNHPLNSNGQPTGLYNGMVHPLIPFAMRGAIWYQGESNVGQAMHYHELMKGLIGGWRKVWNQGDFPFLYVQLAPYTYGGNGLALPAIWEAQTATLAVPNTGMAVLTDIGNTKDIHPKNKQDVGKRLALWALAKTYGKDVVYSGPLYDSMEVEVDQIRLKFKHAEGGLLSRDSQPLSWFTIAGEDKKFVPAEAKIEGDTVLVGSSKISNPVAVRFGWHQLAEPNLANKAGLPASPFRTDAWDDAVPVTP